MSTFDAEDPYRAPAAKIAAETQQERLALEPAGRWRRLFNLLIDYFGTKLLVLAITIPVMLCALLLGKDPLSMSMAYASLPKWVSVAIGLTNIIVYYLVSESLFGATLGKLITGTRVVDERGGRPTLGQIVGRTLCRFIPFEPFSVLFATDGQVRGWHDRIPRTYVVRKR